MHNISKVAIFGSTGKVMREALTILYENKNLLNYDLEILLFTSDKADSKKRLQGFMLDLESSMFLDNFSSKENSNFDINIKITSNFLDLIGSQLIILSIGNWVSLKFKEILTLFERSNRLIQSYSNLESVLKIVSNIEKYCPDALIYSAVNHVDITCKRVRQFYKYPKNFIGISNSVDSVRFIYCLYKKLKTLPYFKDLKQKNIIAYIIGSHDNNMMLLKDSVLIDGMSLSYYYQKSIFDEKLIENVMVETKEFGKLITDLQFDQRHPTQNTGSSILPGKVIANIIMSHYCHGFTFSTSLNTITPFLNDMQISYPVSIKNGTIKYHSYSMTEDEIGELSVISKNTENNIKLLNIFDEIIKKINAGKCVTIGIDGGYLSGKTYLSKELLKRTKKVFSNVSLIHIDKTESNDYKSREARLNSVKENLSVLDSIDRQENQLVIVEGSYITSEFEKFDYIVYLDNIRLEYIKNKDIDKYQYKTILKFEKKYIEDNYIFDKASVVLKGSNILDF